MSALTNVFVLSMCWLLCSIPIVTIGASTVAVFDVTLKMVDDEEGYVAKQFFKAFKANLKQGIILEIITLVCAYVVWMDFQIFNALEDGSIIVLIAGVVAAFVFIFSLAYAYPLTARYVNSVPRILKNSFRISMKYIGRTVGMIALVAIELIAFNWNLTMIFIEVLIGPACIAYTMSVFAKSIFIKIEKDNASE
jgi:uncharacterized membrane protein YesL